MMHATIPTREELAGIVDEVALAYLGVPAHEATSREVAEGDLAVMVSVEGDIWQGAVIVSASAACARCIAADMLSVAESEICDDEARDGLLELANIVAGNLKAVMAADSGSCFRMSVPVMAPLATARATGGIQLSPAWREHSFSLHVVDAATLKAGRPS